MKLKTNLILSAVLALVLSFFIIRMMRKNNSSESPVLKSKLVDLNGQDFDEEKLKNKVLIVSYFQTWCSDCVKEQPELQQLRDKFGDENLEILMVSDESNEKILAFKNRFNSELNFYHAASALKSIGVSKYPTTYLYGKTGKVEDFKVEGINWYNDTTVSLIERLIKE